MTVTLELVGIRMGTLTSGDVVELEAPTSIDALMTRHGTPRAERDLVLCLVSDRLVLPGYLLAAGDRLKLFLPKAGG